MKPEKDISPEDFERMERYLLGKMEPNEQNIFEAELAQNAELRAEVDSQRELIRAIEIGGLHENLDKIHEKTIEKNESRPSRKNLFAIAAGLAAIISVSIWAVNHQSNNEQLFSQYTTTDPGLPVPMSASANYTFHDAMVDYKAEKYDKAIRKWTAQLEAKPESNVLNYYLGSAYFNQEKYKEALPYFAKARNQETGDFRAKAQWYEVLSWLKLDETQKILETNILPDSPYQERIETIKQKLEK